MTARKLPMPFGTETPSQSAVPIELRRLLLVSNEPRDPIYNAAALGVGRLVHAVRSLELEMKLRPSLAVVGAIVVIREALAALLLYHPDRAATESALEALGIGVQHRGKNSANPSSRYRR